MNNWPVKHWYLLVFCSAIVLGTLVSAPHWIHVLDDRYQGIPVHFNADEYSYLPRVQEVLIRGTDSFGIAIAGGEVTPPLQAGLLEKVYGTVFKPFTNQAHEIFTVMDFVMPLLLFLVLIGFLRAVGLSRKQALVVAVLFCSLELYNLGRPIHQRTSFFLLLLSLWGLIAGLEKRLLWGYLGGALMGLLIGVYFWAWTAVWAWWAILTLGTYYANRLHFKKLLGFGVVGLICGLPFLREMYLLKSQPLYEEVFFRSGVGNSHLPESWPWTILFLIMALGAWINWRRGGSIYLSVTVIAAFGLLNQHVVHGVLFLFASHYLFFLVLAATMAVVGFWGHSKTNYLIIGAAAVFLAGIATDNRSVIAQWRIDEADFEEQHLASSLPFLAELDQSVILSDPLGSSFIASHTKHDVLFTHYLQHEFRSHKEIAERYCLTQVFKPVAERQPEIEPVLIYGAAYDAVYEEVVEGRLLAQEYDLLEETCRAVDRNPTRYLDRYQIKYILWDEIRQPDWQISRNLFTKVQTGEGWSLWQRKN